MSNANLCAVVREHNRKLAFRCEIIEPSNRNDPTPFWSKAEVNTLHLVSRQSNHSRWMTAWIETFLPCAGTIIAYQVMQQLQLSGLQTHWMRMQHELWDYKQRSTAIWQMRLLVQRLTKLMSNQIRGWLNQSNNFLLLLHAGIIWHFALID